MPRSLHGHAVLITSGSCSILGFVFLLGFNEAVVVAIPLVGTFLALNAVVVVVGFARSSPPRLLADWTKALTARRRRRAADSSSLRCSRSRSWCSGCRASRPASA